MTAVATRMELHYGDRLIRCFPNRPETVRSFLAKALEEGPDRPAVTDGDKTLSCAELDDAALRVAGALASYGVGKGDRVAIIADNRTEFLLVALACARLAAISVPMGLRLRAPEIAYSCQESGAKVLFHEADLAQHLPASDDIPDVARQISIAGATEGATEFETLRAAAPLAQEPDLAEEDPYCMFYTSGTTGKPNRAVITHFGVVHSAIHWQVQLELEKGLSAVLAIPGSHIAGFAGVVMPVLHLGGHLVLMRNFKADALLHLIESRRIEHALLVPAMYNLFMLSPEMGRRDLSSWKWAVYGGAPMTEATIRGFLKHLPDLRMANAYGATETTSPATIMVPERTLDRSVSIGVSVLCGEIAILDEAGREVPPAETGELFISGPMITPGYWNNPEATKANSVSGFWRSGDVGAKDADGFVTLFDRKKDMIIRAGYKVFSAEVENVLSDHDDILDVAVIGVPDEVLGERVAEVIQRRNETLSEHEVRRFCADRMADYKVPERFRLQDEELPRNANGKLRKDLFGEQMR